MKTGEIYEQGRFSKMEFNPFTVPPGEYFHLYYKRLRRHSGMWTPPVVYGEDEVLDYQTQFGKGKVALLVSAVVIALDKQSPLYEEKDLEVRLASAIATLAIRDGDVAREIISNGPFFSQVVFQFFRMVNDLEYEEWYTNRMSYHNMTAFVRANRTNPDKSTIDAVITARKQLKPLRQEIYQIELNLFSDERTEQLINDMTLADEIGGEAEDYARDEDSMLGGGKVTVYDVQ